MKSLGQKITELDSNVGSDCGSLISGWVLGIVYSCLENGYITVVYCNAGHGRRSF